MGAEPGLPQGTWQVFWCFDGWHSVADRLESILPSWVKLCRIDPTRPLADQVQGAQVLVPTSAVVDREVISAAGDLRLIAQPAAGYSNIDLEAAKEHGVPVTVAPGYNSAATAEIALVLILMLLRRIDDARVSFAANIVGEPVAREASGKTLGIIGLGRIGSALARTAQALGMCVLSTSSGSSREDLESLLRESDIVSLHCPVTPATRGMIGARELALMRPDALFINTARGELVDRAALLGALREGRLGGVGLDVHWEEPNWDPRDELYRHPKVLALPHMGPAAEEVYARLASMLCDNVARCREGRELLHRLC